MSIRSVKGRWGEVFYEGKDEYVGRSLHNYGEYNPDETEKIISLAVPGKLCLDIGANFGVMGQALEANGFTVVSFEPQPYVYSILCKNVAGEKHNCALGSSRSMAKMPKISNGDRANYGGMGIGFRSDLGTIEVPVETLDSYEFENVGFMKIDVEGYEREVLLGAKETIARCRPVMYIEDDRLENTMELRKLIRELGYSIEEHKPPLFRHHNFFGKRVNVWDKHYVSHNIICLP